MPSAQELLRLRRNWWRRVIAKNNRKRRISETEDNGGSEPYVAQAVHFDGATKLVKDGGLVGVTTYTQAVFSFWFNVDDSNVPVATNAGGSFQISLQPDSDLVIDFFDEDFNGDQIVGNAAAPGSGWHHFLAAYDRANESLCKVFLDGVDATGDNGFFNTDDPSLVEDGAVFEIGDIDFLTVWETADFYLAFNQFLDFTNPANVAKFIADGKPVFLGADGSTPTGVPPTVFLSGNAASFPTNKGTGGGFSVVTDGGALTNASTSP